MAEAAQLNLQTAVKRFVTDLDRSHLRARENAMHRCAADCTANTVFSMEEVQACVEKCQVPKSFISPRCEIKS